jgi:hypothetical protein
MNELPIDIIRRIFSFGDPMHRHHVRVLNEKIKDIQFTRQCVFNMIDDDVRFFIDLNPHTFVSGISEVLKLYPVHVKRKIFKFCTSCVCCATHCSNRPRTLDYESNTPIQPGDRCECRCRSIARKIYRAHRFSTKKNMYSTMSIVNRNLA